MQRKIGFIILFLFALNAFAQELTTSNLPIVFIDTKGQSIPDEPKITAILSIVDNANGINNFNDNAVSFRGYIGIEIRGNTAQMFDKKSYTIETRRNTGENLNIGVMGMPPENDWVLHGPYSDKSMMRNALAYHLGNSMGRWSPRTRFCEVLINNEYRGVYLWVEKIKIDKNRVDIADLRLEDNIGDELTGGYLMSIDRDNRGSWNSPFLGRTGSVDVPISYVDPDFDDLTETQRSYIREYITAFEIALDGDNFKDPELGYRAYIDVISFIDYMIMTELSRDLDGYRVSVYFHKDKDSKGGKLVMSPFWDYNLCFGNGNFMQAFNTEGWAADGIGAGDWYEIPFWWDRLQEDPYYNTYLKHRWEQLRESSFSKASIFAYIDSCANVLDEAQQRNFTKFDILNSYVWPNPYIGGTYKNEVSYLKNWTSERIDWLDSQYALIEPAFDIPNSSQSFNKEMKVLAYPNPFTENVTFSIEIEKQSIVKIEIRDILGQLVFSKSESYYTGTNRVSISSPELNSTENGLFIYSIYVNQNLILNGKLIKTN